MSLLLDHLEVKANDKAGRKDLVHGRYLKKNESVTNGPSKSVHLSELYLQ